MMRCDYDLELRSQTDFVQSLALGMPLRKLNGNSKLQGPNL